MALAAVLLGARLGAQPIPIRRRCAQGDGARCAVAGAGGCYTLGSSRGRRSKPVKAGRLFDSVHRGVSAPPSKPRGVSPARHQGFGLAGVPSPASLKRTFAATLGIRFGHFPGRLSPGLSAAEGYGIRPSPRATQRHHPGRFEHARGRDESGCGRCADRHRRCAASLTGRIPGGRRSRARHRRDHHRGPGVRILRAEFPDELSAARMIDAPRSVAFARCVRAAVQEEATASLPPARRWKVLRVRTARSAEFTRQSMSAAMRLGIPSFAATPAATVAATESAGPEFRRNRQVRTDAQSEARSRHVSRTLTRILSTTTGASGSSLASAHDPCHSSWHAARGASLPCRPGGLPDRRPAG